MLHGLLQADKIKGLFCGEAWLIHRGNTRTTVGMNRCLIVLLCSLACVSTAQDTSLTRYSSRHLDSSRHLNSSRHLAQDTNQFTQDTGSTPQGANLTHMTTKTPWVLARRHPRLQSTLPRHPPRRQSPSPKPSP